MVNVKHVAWINRQLRDALSEASYKSGVKIKDQQTCLRLGID